LDTNALCLCLCLDSEVGLLQLHVSAEVSTSFSFDATMEVGSIPRQINRQLPTVNSEKEG